MELYQVLLLVWLLFVTLWIFNQVSAAARRRERDKR